jgi:ABC-type polysaccharide/polyol phosphate export permease
MAGAGRREGAGAVLTSPTSLQGAAWHEDVWPDGAPTPLHPADARIAALRWQVREPPHFGLQALRSHLKETWEHRALLAVLVRRELKARYRGSVLGFGWTLLNPLLLLAVYSLVFRVYLRVDVPHYPLYVLSGLLPWLWLAQTLGTATTALVEGQALATKVLFPPQLLVLVPVLANGVNFAIGVLVVVGVALLTLGASPAGLLTLPFAMLCQTAFLIGISLPLSNACVLFRDVKFLVANLISFWFFLTPIVYTADLVPEPLRPLLWLNPFHVFAHAYQTVLHGAAVPSAAVLVAMAAIGLVASALGVALFEGLREKTLEEL